MTSWDHRDVTNNHLLPYVDSATATEEVSASLKTLPFERNIFKLLANAPTFFPTFMKLLTCAWSPQRSLRSKDWQLVVLRTASLLDAPYEWDVNEPVARVFGYTDAHLACLRSGDLSSTELFSDRQRLISAVVEDLCLRNRVNQDTVLKAKQVLGDEALMDLFYTQGIYAFLARTMNSSLIDFDAPIPGLEDMLRKYNAAIIERESVYTD
ncbi:AhpD-like protein [Aspergillus bertholletiae]|uniref:AhpD-like protein n=1 Tax=Aspergillus bertholletiae TaxID=1226010 RepID=A0A5N7AVS0_9EURO|nr:AhpD-like protein [Aspergillus bertholletiae]